MAESLGPISSSVRIVSGQEVSEARPALPAGAGPGWKHQFPEDSQGWLAEGSTDHFSGAVVFLESQGGDFLPSSRDSRPSVKKEGG